MEDPQKTDITTRQPSPATMTSGSAVPGPPPRADTGLRLERILLRHFDFASQTAQAVRQDASQMIYFYWVMFGVLAAGLGFLLQLGSAPHTQSQATGLAPYAQPLVLLALLGAGTVHLAFYSRWVRLRRRYADCFAFMMGISTFYSERFDHDVPEIATLLAWQPESTDKNALVEHAFLHGLCPSASRWQCVLRHGGDRGGRSVAQCEWRRILPAPNESSTLWHSGRRVRALASLVLGLWPRHARDQEDASPSAWGYLREHRVDCRDAQAR